MSEILEVANSVQGEYKLIVGPSGERGYKPYLIYEPKEVNGKCDRILVCSPKPGGFKGYVHLRSLWKEKGNRPNLFDFLYHKCQKEPGCIKHLDGIELWYEAWEDDEINFEEFVMSQCEEASV